MNRRPTSYSIARNCLQCHSVTNEKLVNAGHKIGAGFELVGWSIGDGATRRITRDSALSLVAVFYCTMVIAVDFTPTMEGGREIAVLVCQNITRIRATFPFLARQVPGYKKYFCPQAACPFLLPWPSAVSSTRWRSR